MQRTRLGPRGVRPGSGTWWLWTVRRAAGGGQGPGEAEELVGAAALVSSAFLRDWVPRSTTEWFLGMDAVLHAAF
ncbi:hypothetical protein VTK73DRAFT_2024 [Phialemonium thermophilum]|uniref:Uncharacterized protein n=1 Tax=Phialemonium thermophilum TaxID=223376 RepID=A0ABR3VSP6_9PEZI